ncbi:TPR-like protein, partial [Martensiomyces pterosporus]
AELEQWSHAVELFDQQNYDSALEIFRDIADSAKIHFNIGLILGRKGDHEGAIEAYTTALSSDRYLVVAYFQRGVARMVLQQNSEALRDFEDALTYLRDNDCIDYSQIGLEYKVYTCEVLYNRALCYFCIGREHEAREDLEAAYARKSQDRHSWIKKAVESNGMDCPLYCVPRGVIYRPSASKLKSSKKIDFLGSAKVLASADGKDNFTGFKGALVRKETMKAAGVK